MFLGAGLLVACAAGAALAGPYFPAAIVLAALVRWFALRAERGFPCTGRSENVIHRTQRGEGVIQRGLRGGSQLALGATFAATAAVYLVPVAKELVAAGLVVVAGLAALWLDVPGALRRVLAVVLGVAALVFVGVCFGLRPAEGVPGGLGTEPITPAEVAAALPGVLLTAVLFLALFDTERRRSLAVGAALAVAVSMGALYQLGPVRLGLAHTSLRDALAAADAAALTTLFNAVVVLATLPALLAALASARRELAAATGTPALVVVGYVLAAAATLLGPATTLLLASILVTGALLIRLLRNRRCRTAVSSDTVPP